jgi:hypothetical protein
MTLYRLQQLFSVEYYEYMIASEMWKDWEQNGRSLF